MTARRDGDAVVIAVTDTGPGIPADQLEHVFTPFWRGQRGEGIGLGLAIARGVVDAHGGRIDLRSQVGEGTTFAVRLPAR